MAETKYIFIWDDRRSRFHQTIRGVVRRGAAKVELGDNAFYRVRIGGENLGIKRDFAGAKKRVRALLKSKPQGTSIWMVAYRGTGERVATVSFRKVLLSTTPDLGAHPEIEKIAGSVWSKFGANQVRSGGLYVCRYISGTRNVSRHGYRGPDWKGAALDIFVENPDSMAHLWQVANWIVAETRAGRLNADTVICGNMIWSRYNNQWRSYGGVYHTHVHVDVPGGWPCM